MSAIQSAKHAVAIRVGCRGSNATGVGAALDVCLGVAGLIFFRFISDDRSVGAHHTTWLLSRSSRLVHRAAGPLEKLPQVARGTRLRRPPLATSSIATERLLVTGHASRLGGQAALSLLAPKTARGSCRLGTGWLRAACS